MHGHVPYRDFAVEYPPGALPGLRRSRARRTRSFALLQPRVPDPDGALRRRRPARDGRCAALARRVGCSARLLRSPFPRSRRSSLGSVILYRYDLWPAALTVAGLAAVLAGRERLGFASLGLGIAAKVFPAVVLPPALAYVWRTRGQARGADLPRPRRRRRRARCSCRSSRSRRTGCGTASCARRRGRCRSRASASGVLLAAHQVGGLSITMESSHGSQNLAGSLPHALGTVSTVLLVVALLAIWLAAARGPATPERLVRYSAASLVAFVALSKVALAAVPDLADPDRAARSGPPRARRLGAPRARTAAHTALVPDPLLGSRAPIRGVPLVGSARSRPRAAGAAGDSAGAYSTGTRSGSQLSARP